VYYLVPEGAVGGHPFNLLREGMVTENKYAVAKVVMFGKEHIVLLCPASVVDNSLPGRPELHPSSTTLEHSNEGQVSVGVGCGLTRCIRRCRYSEIALALVTSQGAAGQIASRLLQRIARWAFEPDGDGDQLSQVPVGGSDNANVHMDGLVCGPGAVANSIRTARDAVESPLQGKPGLEIQRNRISVSSSSVFSGTRQQQARNSLSPLGRSQSFFDPGEALS